MEKCIAEEKIEQAAQRIKNYVSLTPLIKSHYLSFLTGANVYLKTENFQLSRSFKIRGITNKVLSLSTEKRRRGIVVASTGNHGIAAATISSFLNIPVTVFLPDGTSELKVSTLRSMKAKIIFYGDDCLEAEEYARDYAQQHDLTFISPYNDWEVVWGQGTIGYEIFHQLKKLDVVFVPVGGGGLISGISSYLKTKMKNVEIVGSIPINSPVMLESIKAGKIIKMDVQDTLADATKGGIEQGSITFELCKKYVDRFVTISEKEIQTAIKEIIINESMIVEGAAALSVAALLKEKAKYKNRTVVVILSGARISKKHLQKILCNKS